jgi:hypothetical protein
LRAAGSAFTVDGAHQRRREKGVRSRYRHRSQYAAAATALQAGGHADRKRFALEGVRGASGNARPSIPTQRRGSPRVERHRHALPRKRVNPRVLRRLEIHGCPATYVAGQCQRAFGPSIAQVDCLTITRICHGAAAGAGVSHRTRSDPARYTLGYRLRRRETLPQLEPSTCMFNRSPICVTSSTSCAMLMGATCDTAETQFARCAWARCSLPLGSVVPLFQGADPRGGASPTFPDP